MDPQNKSVSDTERTEAVPAQERVASGDGKDLPLSAEQVYAQRFAESFLQANNHAQGFIP